MDKIKVRVGSTAGVSVTVDDELSLTSENPVQNKVVTAALNSKQDILTIDSTLSPVSENPVQNKAVTAALNDKQDILTPQELSGMVLTALSPEMHANIFRGKYLGDHVTAEQFAAVVNGTFDDLYIGDYWTIPVTIDGTEKSINWRIADIDYMLYTGQTRLTAHHLVIVPDTFLYISAMETNSSFEGGYRNCSFYNGDISKARNAINAAFENMVLTHQEFFANITSAGRTLAAYVYEATVELMNEYEVYGHAAYTVTNRGGGYYSDSVTEFGKTQFALFRMAPRFINIRKSYWTRDLVDTNKWAIVGGFGAPASEVGSVTLAVRPYFLLGAAEESA